MKLGLIGAGNMASALARGIGEPVLVHDVDEAKADALVADLGGEVVATNAELSQRADALMLCHKPKQPEEVAAEVGDPPKAVISILAAVSTDLSRCRLPRRLDLPLHPEHADRGPPRGALLCAGPGRRRGPGGRDPRADGPLGHGDPARRRAADRAGHGADGLRARVHGTGGRDIRRGGRRARAGSPTSRCAWSSRRWAAPPSTWPQHDYDGPDLRTRVATPGGTTERGLITLEERGLRDVTRAAVDAVVEATR